MPDLYCRYPISYRDLETMMTERGVAVDHSTIYRWVQHFAPEMERRLRWQWRWPRSRSWRIDAGTTSLQDGIGEEGHQLGVVQVAPGFYLGSLSIEAYTLLLPYFYLTLCGNPDVANCLLHVRFFRLSLLDELSTS